MGHAPQAWCDGLRLLDLHSDGKLVTRGVLRAPEFVNAGWACTIRTSLLSSNQCVNSGGSGGGSDGDDCTIAYVVTEEWEPDTGKIVAVALGSADNSTGGWIDNDNNNNNNNNNMDMDMNEGMKKDQKAERTMGACGAHVINAVDAMGTATCHSSVSTLTNSHVFACNYMSGSVVAYALDVNNNNDKKKMQRKNGGHGGHGGGSGSGGSSGKGALIEKEACSAFVALDANSGSGVNAERQEAPHAHQVLSSPDGRYLLVPDLGADAVIVFKVEESKEKENKEEEKATTTTTTTTTATGKTEQEGGSRNFEKVNDKLQAPPSPRPPSISLTPHTRLTTAPGSGPRHAAFSSDGNLCYVLNELDSTIVTCKWDATAGSLTAVHTVSTLPSVGKTETYPLNMVSTTAAIRVIPNNDAAGTNNHGKGDLVLCTNRGHNSLTLLRATTTTSSSSTTTTSTAAAAADPAADAAANAANVNAAAATTTNTTANVKAAYSNPGLTFLSSTPSLGVTPRDAIVVGGENNDIVVVANQDSHALVTFHLDSKTAMLEPTGYCAYAPSVSFVASV